MKCPTCGQWNRASIPRCMKCGTPLASSPAGEDQTPSWRKDLRDAQPPPSYVRIDQDGLDNDAPDSRDTLAGEMQDLKTRKTEGAQRQRRLRSTASRPNPTAVRTHTSEETFARTGTRSPRSERDYDTPTVYIDTSHNRDPLWKEAEIYGTRFQMPVRDDLTGFVSARTRRMSSLMRSMW